MTKTKDAIITQINNLIKANNNNEITGVILNGVLREMTNSLSTPYFLFPKHDSVSESDIGKIAMNDGSGTAKVYAYSPATIEQLGKWEITLDDIIDLFDNSKIEINSNAFSTNINRATWRNGNTPTTVTEELELLRDYINGNPMLVPFLSVSVSGDKLTIDETTFQATEITSNGFPKNALEAINTSLPPLPAAPTAFPLGKLLGIEVSNVIISSRSVETFTLDSPLTLNNAFFNTVNNVAYPDVQTLLTELLKFAIVPSANGYARALSDNDIQPLNGVSAPFKLVFRHQFLGIAIATAGNNVTVYDLKQFSLLIGVLLNLSRRSVIDIFN